jgi:16S rRNA (guanine527-N7)-methyltransferase
VVPTDAQGRAPDVVLESLAARYGLDRRQQDQLAALLRELETNQHAPTAVRSPEQAVDAHIADSLVALETDAVRAAARLADLGAGPGFPGLALAVALGGCEVSLVESQTRKCLFLSAVVAAVEVQNARVICSRAEEWGEGAREHDVVVARALAPQTVVLEYAAPLLRMGGALVDWRGRRDPSAEEAADRAASVLGLSRVETRRVMPFEQATDRHLHVFVKVEETPARFPRRPGIARKRPLGA